MGMTDQFQTVQVPTSDGRILNGTMVEAPHSPLGVVLLHIYGGDRHDWAPLQLALRSADISSIAVDYRGNAGSGTPQDAVEYASRHTPLFLKLHLDAEAAKRFLLAHTQVDPKAVGLIGASIGTITSLRTAVRDPSIPAIAVMSPGLDYLGMNARQEMQAYGARPILMTFAEREWGEPVAADTWRRMHVDPRMVTLWGFDADFDAGHGTAQFGLDATLPVRMAEWIKPHLWKALDRPHSGGQDRGRTNGRNGRGLR